MRPVGALLLLVCAASVHAESRSRIIDLGHPLAASDPTWSGLPVFSRTASATTDKDGFAAGTFTSDEHTGTHLDAPAHFAAGHWTVDEIPVDHLYRPGVCINIVSKVERDEDYRLTLEDVRAYEKATGPIPGGAIVLVATGWDGRWSEPGRYMNQRGAVKHFPGFSIEAAGYLARERHVAGIGIDTPSVDYGPSASFEVHHLTMPRDLFHVENATGLTALPPSGFMVLVAPINVAGGSGGPARVFALFEQR